MSRTNVSNGVLLNASRVVMLLLTALLGTLNVSALAPRTPADGWQPAVPLNTAAASWVAEGGGLLAYGADARVSFAKPESPAEALSTLTLSAPVSGAAIVGRYAYLAQEGLGLRVLDLAIPSEPADLGLIPFEGSTFKVTQWADYLLIASDYGMTVLSLATRHTHVSDPMGGHCMAEVDPFALGEVSSVALDGVPSALAAMGTQAFVATESGRLLVVDLSDREAPKIISNRELSAQATALAPYAAWVMTGLAPGASPMVQNQTGLGVLVFGAQGLASTGRTLFIAAGRRGLFFTRNESALSTTFKVNVGNFFFSPSTVNINTSDEVEWDFVGGFHSSTSGSCAGGDCTPDGQWDSGVKSSGSFRHTFLNAGTDNYYCSVHLASMTGKVVVTQSGPPPLTAISSAAPVGGAAPLSVVFTGSASGGTPPYAYSWAFGDGTTSPSQNPSHVYAAAGTYSAVLTVTDSVAATATAPAISITASSSTPEPPVVTSMKKVAPPFRIVVTGSHLEDGIKVFINGTEWMTVTRKNSNKLKLTGGKALKAAVPKGTVAQFRFTNLDGGSTTQTFSW